MLVALKSHEKNVPFSSITIARFVRACGVAALLVACAAAAQSPGPVETRLDARKVVRGADGRDAFAPAEAARPGELIEYTATYRNTGSRSVTGLLATLPIPANTEYVQGSARPAGARASADARRFADMPVMRQVMREGREREEAMPLADYRYLRWDVGTLAPGQSVQVTARVRVMGEARASAEPSR